MKRLLVALVMVLALALAVAPAIAQTKAVQINFEWDQQITTDFWGWRMYVSTTQGGPYDYLGTDANGDAVPLFVVQYDPANPTGPFSGTGNVTAPDNAETTFYFVVVAFDTAGNFSANSNEVSYTADFLGPDAPVLRVTGSVIITTP